MNNDNNNIGWRSISGPSNGTAGKAVFQSVISGKKQEKEVFWVTELIDRLDEYKNQKVKVFSNPDDSDGNHDVVIEISKNHSIGIQVTELTYRLIRDLSSQRQRIIERLHKFFQEEKITCETKVLIKFFISLSDSGKPKSLKLRQCADPIQEILRHLNNRVRILQFDFGRVLIIPIDAESNFYISSYGNIGIDLDFDFLPQSAKRYFDAIDDLVRKKENSKSSWLLIWSLEFWIDKQWLGENVIQYMKNKFASTKFERVYFMESHDGEGIFQANLTLYKIKD